MQFEVRDVVIVLNGISMVGGAFYLVGMLKNEIRHLSRAIESQSTWLAKVQSRLDTATVELAVLKEVVGNHMGKGD